MTSPSQIKARLADARARLALSPIQLTALTVGFLFLADNATFWRRGAEIFAGQPLSFAGYMLAIYCLTLAAFSLFAFRWLVRPFLALMLLLAAASSYYMDRLGVIIDRDMIQNVMVTTVTESKHLITADFVLHMLLFGLLPAALVLCVKITPQSRIKALGLPLLTFTLGLAMTAGLLMADLKSYSAVLRERKDFMSSYQPGAPLVGMIRYAKMVMRTANVTVASVGADAEKGASYGAGAKPVLTILVAGETARAQNFGLNGYARDTTPKLGALPIVNFSNVSSCGTATAVSLPCMFSPFGRKTYSYEEGLAHENLLDVLAHAGLHVEWWDNNTGDKNIAKRLPSLSFSTETDPAFCAHGECMDGIFLAALRAYAASVTQDTVLVLHEIGSHGPTYHLRYPEAFERFKPACRTAEFKNCTPEEIVNAYDNTIAYTDAILAEMIAVLQGEERLATALVYASDHGESLGENGLYLHGSPYFMAPEFQTKVPMLLWMSEGFAAQFGHDAGCLAKNADAPLSHDNLFHSVLGMLDVRTTARAEALDVFAPCQTHDIALKR